MTKKTSMLVIGILAMGCSRPEGGTLDPLRRALLVNYPVQDVWDATTRLVFEKNWTMDVVDEGKWNLVSVLMEMPSYGNSHWWDCGMRPTSTVDTDSNPINPSRTHIVSVHHIQIFPISDDSTGVFLTMAPHRRGSVLIPCRSRGGYERLFYEQIESTLVNLANDEDDES
jgi:hypothetical protein